MCYISGMAVYYSRVFDAGGTAQGGGRRRSRPYLSQDIDRILDAGKYLTRLIDMILDLAKIESGKMKLNMQEHDIGAVIAGAIDRRRQEIEANGNTLQFDISSDIGTGIVDATRLEQIVDSIVVNAATYTQNGDVEILLRSELSWGVPYFNLAVRDTGPGIAEDAIPSIFEGFGARRDAANGRYGGPVWRFQ